MNRLLGRSSFRYLLHHPWHMVFSLLGVALGVGVVFSIDVVNHSARRAFQLSTAATTGKATHMVVGGPTGVADSVYTRLRVESGYRDSAPVVEGFVGIESLPGRAFQVLGVDVFAEPPFRAHLSEERLTQRADLSGFMAGPASMYAPQSLATELGLKTGDSLALTHQGTRHTVNVLGFFTRDAELGEGLGNILIMDIATAQGVLDSPGRISRIDLMVSGDQENETVAGLQANLPQGVRIERSQSRSQKIEEMSLAFSQNLFALSLLALVVGMFLIYNTMTFSVVRRWGYIGDLRALGVTRGEVFHLVLLEAAAIGAVGTVAGVIIGSALSQVLLNLVTQSINDLYYVVNVREAQAGASSILKAILLGVGTTLVSAAVPALEATGVRPRFAQHRSALESGVRSRVPLLSGTGVGLLLLGAAALAIPTNSLALAYTGMMLLVLGFAFLTPGFLVITLGRIPGFVMNRLGALGRMASRGVLAQLSRSAVAIAALGIAVGTTVGVTTMVTSFRDTVVTWLETTLDADIYISPPTLVSSRNDAAIDPKLLVRVASMNGVRNVNLVRGSLTETQHGLVNLVALDMARDREQRFHLLQGEGTQAWKGFRENKGVLISEPYAQKHGASVGDSLLLPTQAGQRGFRVEGVYRDFASDVGTVMMSMGTYRKAFGDMSVSGIALFLENPSLITPTIREINGMLTQGNEVVVRSNRDLRERSIEIFDRTFTITNVLRLLTVLVAFIGVLTALMATQLERSRELGVLRAMGFTPGQLWRLVTAQTSIMGFLAGIVALPFGMTLAMLLIYVVNKRSFGWTLDMSFGPHILLQAMAVAVVAAVLAGIYPSYKMSRTPPARALREE